MPGELSEGCQALFDALLVEPEKLLAKLHDIEMSGGFRDGTRSNHVFTSFSNHPLWGNWSRSWLAEHGFEQSVWSSITIAEIFQQREGLNGLSLPYGLGILLRGNSGANAATIAHEIFHQFRGLDDEIIQKRWGLKVDRNNTRNITDKFKKECL